MYKNQFANFMHRNLREVVLNWVGVNTKWQQKYRMTIAWVRNLKLNTLYLSPSRVISIKESTCTFLFSVLFSVCHIMPMKKVVKRLLFGQKETISWYVTRLNRWILDLSNIQRVLATNSYPAGSLRNTELMLNFSTSYQLLNSSNALAWICLYIRDKDRCPSFS